MTSSDAFSDPFDRLDHITVHQHQFKTFARAITHKGPTFWPRVLSLLAQAASSEIEKNFFLATYVAHSNSMARPLFSFFFCLFSYIESASVCVCVYNIT